MQVFEIAIKVRFSKLPATMYSWKRANNHQSKYASCEAQTR